MKRNIIIIFAVAASLAIGYWIGYFKASVETSVTRMNNDLEHWAKLAELDKSFLANIASEPSTLTSGTYVLETSFPGKPPIIEMLDLVFSNGQFALPKPTQPNRMGMADNLAQNGRVVSWHQEGVMYEANAEYVGLIDGNMAWGRLYGWNPGDESIGCWKIYPKPIDDIK